MNQKMSSQDAVVAFDAERAAIYDRQFEKVAALNGALHLLTRLVLQELPLDARVLCVGAGTGAELLALAEAFPGWTFAALDPSAPMLDVCRRKAEESGITARCVFHAGTLDTLPASQLFDAATCFLVSHFLVERDKRRDFFAQIAARLRPGALLVSSDLTADRASPEYERTLEVWQRMLAFAEAPPESIAQILASYGHAVAVLPPREVEEVIAAGGFDAPTPFYRALLIHAWFARRAASQQVICDD